MLKIVCFKWKYKEGYKLASLNNIEKYTATHVNKLCKAVKKNLSIPHEFICITDDARGLRCKSIRLWDKCMDYGGCYNRLYVFSKDMKELIGDRFICIDLDMAIVGPLDNLFDRDESFIINQFYGKHLNQYYNGALFMMDAGARDRVWSEFEKDIPGNIEKLIKLKKQRKYLGTDQAWISYILGIEEPLFTIDDGVIPYYLLPKNDNKVYIPDYATIINFAGRQDPSNHKDKWVRDYWDSL